MISVHTSPIAPFGRPDTGGMNVYIRELSRHLAARGVAVDIFTRRSDPAGPQVVEIDAGVRLIQVEAGPAQPIDKDGLFCYLPEFASDVASFAIREGTHYDLVHAHYWLSGWAGHLLQEYWNAPLVVMFHTLAHLKNAVARNDRRETTLRLQVERRLLDLGDAIIAANPDERDDLVQRAGGDAGRITLVPPGVDLEHFRPGGRQAARRALNLPDDGPLVLFVGRIDPIKGIDTLLDAFHRLLGEHVWPDGAPRLVFVGGLMTSNDDGTVMDADLRRLADRATAMGLGDSVLFRGAQPRDLLPLYYNAVDVCVVPSRYESFGLVAIEAMACGTPIVATRVGGLRFTIEDGISGLLVPHSDPERLSAALRRVLTDHDLRSRMQVGARQAAVHYSWQTITAAVLDVYERLLARDHVAAGPAAQCVS